MYASTNFAPGFTVYRKNAQEITGPRWKEKSSFVCFLFVFHSNLLGKPQHCYRPKLLVFSWDPVMYGRKTFDQWATDRNGRVDKQLTWRRWEVCPLFLICLNWLLINKLYNFVFSVRHTTWEECTRAPRTATLPSMSKTFSTAGREVEQSPLSGRNPSFSLRHGSWWWNTRKVPIVTSDPI